MTNRTLIKGGIVYSVDPEIGDFAKGDVLIEDDKIVAVGADISADDVRLVDATNMIVMPGLVDTHRHLWQSALRQIAADWTIGQYVEMMLGVIGPRFSAEDVLIADLLGSLEALDGGVTTILDWSHIVNSPEHADAAVQGLTESGIRAIYAYGAPRSPMSSWYEDDVARVQTAYFSSGNSRLTMALASLGAEFSSLDEGVNDIELARRLGLRTSVHLGVGLLGEKRAVTNMNARGLLGPDIIYVHCTTCLDAELRLISESGGHVSISPRVEMQMGHGYPATGRLLSAGIQPSLSVDVVSAVGGSLFAEMRGTLEAERGLQNRIALERGEWVGELELLARDVVRMATIEGARTLGMEDKIGSLTPGKQADVIMLKVDMPNLSLVNDLSAAITLADTGNVETIFVAGRLVKMNGTLLSHDMRAVQDRAWRSRDRLLPGLTIHGAKELSAAIPS
ncbi:MAG TPA: amidohydrolase family protein [Acidimicrobiales bacterium]|jgi:cytosine/adenosine deaminase-related metal-dependent hydrolase